MSRLTRYNALIQTYGFLPGEARTLSHTSRAGFHASYFQRMLNARRALWLNAHRYNWTNEQYRDTIKRQYAERGCFKQDILGRIRADVWQLLRWYEERTEVPEEYESPWRKKVQRRSGQRREYKRITRKIMLGDWIAQLDRQLANPTLSEMRRTKLQQQRQNLQRQQEQMR